MNNYNLYKFSFLHEFIINLFEQLTITVNERSYTYITYGDQGNNDEVDEMLMTLASALKGIFPSVPLT